MTLTPELLLPALHGIRHGFFGREGGVSEGIYASLNCGYGSGDHMEKVRENRTRVALHLGGAEPDLITCYQIHSSTCVAVETPWARDAAPQADAMVTRNSGIILSVLTADCAPILFADANAGVIGAAHAGWKGAYSGVVEATVSQMESLGASRANIMAAIGPCIGQPSYEVGPEFVARLVEQSADNAVYFTSPHGDDKAFFDLRGYVKNTLYLSGIKQIFTSDHDTRAEEGAYYSYRRTTLRQEGTYGRQIACITLR